MIDARGSGEVCLIKKVRKRDGRIVPFDRSKIADAIFKAAEAVGGKDATLAEELSKAVTFYLERTFGPDGIPDIEDIQDAVEKVLIETGHAKTAKAYILYRDMRNRMRREMRVRKEVRDRSSTTDVVLLVSAPKRDEVTPWDKRKIVEALIREAGVSEGVAGAIASSVEEKVLNSGLTQVTTGLIRELVDNELFLRGYDRKLARQQVIGIPTYDLEQLFVQKANENSNIGANNPEAINLFIAETIIKQYMLQHVFSRQVADAHMCGFIHVHDLGYPRVYCSSHSLEYIKKYGLELGNLDTASAPAAHARTLTGHLNTFLASMQAYYAGALGVAYVNVMYAPFLVGMSYQEVLQEAQYLIFSGSQNAFSRGGQTLFLDFNVHLGVPSYLWDVPAIGPRGEYTGKTYGEYEKEAQTFARALLEVWRAGDRYGRVFAFPKCDLHITEECFTDPVQKELLELACLVASENGSPYFVFDRDEVTLSACCRLRTAIKDNYMIRHPESMRFCGFQNVTVNLPQCAYRAGRGNFEGLKAEVARAMDIAMQAHLEKKAFIARLMSGPGAPLWEIGKLAKDGRPYVDLSAATYIIGLIGLNEAMLYCFGKELHEDEEVFKAGLRLVAFMNLRAKEYQKQYGLHVALEESPAESAARRVAKVDLRQFPQAAEVLRGDLERDEVYYTNSIHFRADAPVSLLDRIRYQSKFHPLIESGAIIHAFVGEKRPSPASIFNLVEKTWRKTQAAQITISPEFTMCRACRGTSAGIHSSCPICGSADVSSAMRSGRFGSRLNDWEAALPALGARFDG